jgi:glycosyltransferase involved in cell wall biosynthesis
MMNGNMNGRNRRRHCMVVHADYPIGETRVEREALALVDQGYQVDVICLRYPMQPELAVVDGVQVHRLPVWRFKYGSGLAVQLFEYLAFFTLAFIRLARLHRQRHYNAVQVHNLPDFLVFAALIPKLSGARIILDLHDLMPEFYAERSQLPMDSLPGRLIRWQEQISCRFADQVITVTEVWRQALIQRGQPADKVAVVMNVADSRIFHRGAAPDVAPRDDGCFQLIYHGSFHQRYGLDLILRAVGTIRHSVPHIRLTLHGDGEYQETLMNMVSELGLQDYVQFSTHFVPTAGLPDLLKKADLAVVPYRNGVFTGGILPTKLMEYTALGIPAIAARTPTIEHYFDDTMVEFFEPGDVDGLARCIRKLSESPERLAQLAQGSEKFNRQHSWTQVSAEYVALVDRLSTR